MPLFATLTNERICQEIEASKKHVILAAPGICVPVAKALQHAHQRLGQGAVQVVLDVSARVTRLGYGEHAAVEMLSQAGVMLRQHAGLRIGALICDDAGWSFATSPSLVEADLTADSEAFNAITLTSAQVMVLRVELPPVIKGENFSPALEYPVVGSEPVEEATLCKVKRALEIAPPQQFDLARQTQVYAALIQFVELTFEGFNIQSRRIQLPKTLPLIATQDKALKDRVTASLKVLDKVEKPKALQEVTEKLEELRQAYLVPVGQAGRVMLKSKRQSFENELTKIEKDLDDCKEALKKDLQEALNKVIDAIIPDLSRAVMANPPSRFRGLFLATEESAAVYVREELAKSFPTAEELVFGMKIHKFYKDVTYETLKNKDFGERVMKEIPQSVMDGALLKEEVAAKAGPVMS
ncbi:hypothetical protein C8R21_1227 [Nitrosospira multiformis]|uniref:Uncharacterized protein n=1 Tax=Nitrosospira multiformis TaxID=1231 RepID=A0A2T5I7J9_9PROT|nr:hypothetical protein [Nitrosospira multiformis]PTQ79803.1 hypothetical protein C8R21_1227 [Nitrosospira multiformis]